MTLYVTKTHEFDLYYEKMCRNPTGLLVHLAPTKVKSPLHQSAPIFIGFLDLVAGMHPIRYRVAQLQEKSRDWRSFLRFRFESGRDEWDLKIGESISGSLRWAVRPE